MRGLDSRPPPSTAPLADPRRPSSTPRTPRCPAILHADVPLFFFPHSRVRLADAATLRWVDVLTRVRRVQGRKGRGARVPRLRLSTTTEQRSMCSTSGRGEHPFAQRSPEALQGFLRRRCPQPPHPSSLSGSTTPGSSSEPLEPSLSHRPPPPLTLLARPDRRWTGAARSGAGPSGRTFLKHAILPASPRRPKSRSMTL